MQQGAKLIWRMVVFPHSGIRSKGSTVEEDPKWIIPNSEALRRKNGPKRDVVPNCIN